MHRATLALLACLAGSTGCAVIKTTDVTDAAFKRHQSIAVLGWPIYARVTDRERGSSTQLVTKIEGTNESTEVQPAELLGQALEPASPNAEYR